MNHSDTKTGKEILQLKECRPMLDDIAKALAAEIGGYLKNPDRTAPGLLDGMAGHMLFLHRYMRHAEGMGVLHDALVDACLERVGAGYDMPTYCSGLSGILHTLRREYADEVDTAEAESLYAGYLSRCAEAFLRMGNWDFLHGAVGIGCYFLGADSGSPVHELILDYLKSNSEPAEKGRKIISVTDHKTGEKGYNISLSHGMSAITVYLCRLYALTGDGRAAELATDFVNYILAQRMDFDTYGSGFPSMSLGEKPSKSRLGWCYGDLGVCRTLFHAGGTLDRPEWREQALDVLRLDCGRRGLNDNYVMDASVCHGSAGIALIFRRMYLDTGEEVFAGAARYWLEQTLKMSRFPDGPAGYKYYIGQDGTWRGEYSLLEGIAGVGLTLLAFLYDEEWEDLLLI